MFKKLIAFEINIPEEFRDNEDRFMEQLLRQVSSPYISDKLLIFDTGKKTFTFHEQDIFTRKYEFVDPIKGWS